MKQDLLSIVKSVAIRADGINSYLEKWGIGWIRGIFEAELPNLAGFEEYSKQNYVIWQDLRC